MKIKNSVKIFLQILLWGIILILPLYIMTSNGTTDYKPYIGYLVRMGILAVLFYLNYLYLIDKFLFNKKFIAYIGINLVLIVALVTLQTVVMSSLFADRIRDKQMPRTERMQQMPPAEDGQPQRYNEGPVPPKGMHPRDEAFAYMRVLTDYVLIILIIGISVALKATYRWYRDSMNLEQVKSVQLEADLQNLRTQLNPHFLFNTLNNIYSLIAIDTDKAQDSVHRLSGMLRHVLYENEQFVPMDKELEFTRNYIDLMALRLSSSVKLDVMIEDGGCTDSIASLMFVTLIENAFKHGIKSGANSFIDIKILVEKGKGVLCTVENSLVENERDMEAKNSGIGLANLSKRLELIYPDRYEFVTERREDSFFALLRIDLGNKKNIEV